MVELSRELSLESLLKHKTHFLFGPRGTGKSTLIRQTLTDKALIINLLDSKLKRKLQAEPEHLRELVLGSRHNWTVIDEIQFIPSLLNEVHLLIAEHQHVFLLTGSSARRLRQDGINLLGGRARKQTLHPLTMNELGEHFKLEHYLKYGGLPEVYFSDSPHRDLADYCELYLSDEIEREGVTRDLPAFVRFLEIMALNSGAELHYTNLSNDAQVKASTVKNYIRILEDTLLGIRLEPFLKTKKRKAVERSKFYLFDVGVRNALVNDFSLVEKTPRFGICFEHFMVQQINATLSYLTHSPRLNYWRSRSGFEADLIVNRKTALEIKSKKNLTKRDFKGLRALKEEALLEHYIVVYCGAEQYKTEDGIQVIPYQVFLKEILQYS